MIMDAEDLGDDWLGFHDDSEAVIETNAQDSWPTTTQTHTLAELYAGTPGFSLPDISSDDYGFYNHRFVKFDLDGPFDFDLPLVPNLPTGSDGPVLGGRTGWMGADTLFEHDTLLGPPNPPRATGKASTSPAADVDGKSKFLFTSSTLSAKRLATTTLGPHEQEPVAKRTRRGKTVIQKTNPHLIGVARRSNLPTTMGESAISEESSTDKPDVVSSRKITERGAGAKEVPGTKTSRGVEGVEGYKEVKEQQIKKLKRQRGDPLTGPAPPGGFAKQRKIQWSYEMRYSLHLICVEGVKNPDRERLFNRVYQAELPSLGCPGIFAYSRMSQQNGDKERKDRPPHSDWQKILIHDAADEEEKALRAGAKVKVGKAAADLGISLSD